MPTCAAEMPGTSFRASETAATQWPQLMPEMDRVTSCTIGLRMEGFRGPSAAPTEEIYIPLPPMSIRPGVEVLVPPVPTRRAGDRFTEWQLYAEAPTGCACA